MVSTKAWGIFVSAKVWEVLVSAKVWEVLDSAKVWEVFMGGDEPTLGGERWQAAGET